MGTTDEKISIFLENPGSVVVGNGGSVPGPGHNSNVHEATYQLSCGNKLPCMAHGVSTGKIENPLRHSFSDFFFL